jgi:hypothetical protein
MRLKRSNTGVCVCALASFVVLAATALTAASALALPEGRAYEMVSPVYKGGYGTGGIRAVEPQGESVVFGSLGGFAGPLSGGVNASHFYLARRGPSGWSTVSFEPAVGGLSDVSANLEYALGSGPLGPNAGAETFAATEEVWQLHRADQPNTAAGWEVFGGLVVQRVEGGEVSAVEQGASGDLCHVVVGNTYPLLLGALNTADGEQIYDLSRGCGGGEPSLRLVGLNNQEALFSHNCSVELGSGEKNSHGQGVSQESNFHAVSSDGSEIFFTTNAKRGEASPCGDTHDQLFVRLGGARTVEVSRPLEAAGVPLPACTEVPCAGAAGRASAHFMGASEDGSRVFFTTNAPLVEGDGDTGSDLYMATIGCPPGEGGCEAARREVTSLVQVSHDPAVGEAAEVQGVARVAPDGSRVYFVAHGVLSEGANAQGHAPVKGADNLYLYDGASGRTVFVAGLCSGPGRSGAAEDARCPRTLEENKGDNELLWGSDNPEAQSTGNGAFLVFCTYAQLLPNDTDTAKDVYRYDAETGALARVSAGEGAYHADGNDSAFDADIEQGHLGGAASVNLEQEMARRAISEDGSRIVFHTREPLSPDAIKGHTNIYEWHEGSVSLISSGAAEEDDLNASITASGRDIFFETSQGLVPQDTDGLSDVYDARLGGGFTPAPAERQQCSSDACQGPLTNPAPLLVPGSVSQAPGGNFAAPPSKPAPSVKKATPKCPKGKKLSHGKCVKTKKAKAKKANKSGHRRGR